MGLTIHYEIATPSDWGKATIRAKLEAARQYAKALPVVSVSDLAEFQGKDADFQHVREMGQEEQEVARLDEEPASTVSGNISFETSVAEQPRIEVQVIVNVFKP